MKKTIKLNRHVKTVITFFALVPSVYYIPPLISEYITQSHFIVTILSLAIIVPVTSYAAIPALTGIISGVNKAWGKH